MAFTEEKRKNVEWGFKFALDIITLGLIPLIQAIKARREKKKLQNKLNKIIK